jgi:hypothetical protein
MSSSSSPSSSAWKPAATRRALGCARRMRTSGVRARIGRSHGLAAAILARHGLGSRRRWLASPLRLHTPPFATSHALPGRTLSTVLAPRIGLHLRWSERHVHEHRHAPALGARHVRTETQRTILERVTSETVGRSTGSTSDRRPSRAVTTSGASRASRGGLRGEAFVHGAPRSARDRVQASSAPVSAELRRHTLVRWFSTLAIHRTREPGVERVMLRAGDPTPMPLRLVRHLVGSHAPMRARRSGRETTAWWRIDVHRTSSERLHLETLVLQGSIRDAIAGHRRDSGDAAPPPVVRAHAHPPAVIAYAHPAPRVPETVDRSTSRATPPSEAAPAAAPPIPTIDYEAVTRRVYDEIQRRVAIERERRGY